MPAIIVPKNNAKRHQFYGWKPDAPDHRDLQLKVCRGITLPSSLDYEPGYPAKPYDQGELGSCVFNAGAANIQFLQQMLGLQIVMPSRLYAYYNTRCMEGTARTDSGASIRDAIKSYNRYGDCPESIWPYDPAQFAARPPKACYAAGQLQNRAIKYQRVEQTLNGIKQALVLEKKPIVCGISVYESFESDTVAADGLVPLPGPAEACVGAHGVSLCGFNDAIRKWKLRNSWGVDWGDRGYFYLDYAYLTNPNLADDFWTIELINGAAATKSLKKAA